MALVIGVTGGIGCGKTTVSDLFAKLGAPVIDADLVSRQLTDVGGAALSAIRQRFGDVAMNADGSLDRAYMRQLIFNHPQAKIQLEALLHPLIFSECQRLLQQFNHHPLVLLVVPLLLQHTEFKSLVQRILVIDCEPEQQITRVQARSQLDEVSIRAIMAQQLSRAALLAQADDVIYNQADLQNLSQQVSSLYKSYLENINSH